MRRARSRSRCRVRSRLGCLCHRRHSLAAASPWPRQRDRAPTAARCRWHDGVMTVPLWSRSATWLATAIRERQVSSLEVVDACLARIEAVNPRINAVVRLAADARDRARAADATLARGDAAGPLHGVPFTIKDSMDTAGVVTTAGTVGWRDRVPDRDATVVARLRAAGGILLGKTNTPSSPGRTRPTTTSTAGPRTRTTSTGRPAAAAAARRRSSPPAARRSTSAATAATASASPRTCAASPGSSRRAGACRGPGTGRASGACSSRSRSSGRSRAGSRTWRWSCRSSPARTARIRTSCRSRLGDPDEVDVGTLRVAWFGDNGIRTPTPETLEAVGRAVAAIRRPARPWRSTCRPTSPTRGRRGRR